MAVGTEKGVRILRVGGVDEAREEPAYARIDEYALPTTSHVRRAACDERGDGTFFRLGTDRVGYIAAASSICGVTSTMSQERSNSR